MADDNTTIFVPSGLKGPEDKEHQESYWLNRSFSGRFWISVILAIGVVVVTILVLSGTIKLESNAALAVYTSFSTGAFSLVGIYMGQNMKPKTSSEVTSNEKT